MRWFFLLNLSLNLSPDQCLLHLNFRLTKHDTFLVNNLLITAKRLIAKKWKPEEEPTVQECHVKCQYLALMNKLTAIKITLNGSEFALFIFCTTWSKFVNYRTLMKPNDNIRDMILEL